ncbi:MAG: PaaI family thioesterase [Solirubrobacteraceae bacterium]
MITWDDQAPLKQSRELTGIETLRRVAGGALPRPAVSSLFGWDDLSEFDAGRAVASFLPEERHYSPLGVVHGGVAMSLLDTAMATAAHSVVEASESCVTTQLKALFVRVITRGVGRLRCEGTVLHREGDLIETKASIVDERGKRYAHGTGMCRVQRA